MPRPDFGFQPKTGGGFIIYFSPFSSKIDLVLYCKHIFKEQNKIHLSVIFMKKGRIVSTFWTSFIHNFIWFSDTQIVRLNKIRDRFRSLFSSSFQKFDKKELRFVRSIKSRNLMILDFDCCRLQGTWSWWNGLQTDYFRSPFRIELVIVGSKDFKQFALILDFDCCRLQGTWSWWNGLQTDYFRSPFRIELVVVGSKDFKQLTLISHLDCCRPQRYKKNSWPIF